MPRLVLSFLGLFEIKRNDDYLIGLTAKTQALIAYLAIEAQRPHRREVLAGLLWGGQGEAAARNNLRQSLHQLQHTLGAATAPWLLITPQTVQFNPACDHALDVVEFTRLLTDCAHHPHRCLETCRTCHVRLQRAAALYRGPLLAGLSLKDSDAFEEWLQVKREHLAQHALSLLSTLADYHARHSEYALMEQAARRQIEVDPYSEEAHRRVMRACAWSGRRNLALLQYETCRRLLKDELGVEPVSETTALYDSLRAGNVAPAHLPTATQLPMPLTSFVGRGSDMSHVQRLLETTRLLTLIGTGGCGKTRLALQVAAELAEEFPDGAWFIELAPHADPALVPALVANALGVREQAGRTHLELVTDYLRHKQLLLVLDNCEHLLDACARLVAAVLRAAPRVQLLATSRAPIGLAGEQVVDVLPLPVPDLHAPLNLEALAQIESVRLFAERTTAANSQFELTAANAPAVARICRQLEGIPLALEIAAARTRALPIEEMVQRLDERFRLLTGSNRAAPPRQQTLQATMDWSYNLLAPPERLLLNRLAVFAGGWTLAAAEAVCSDERLPSTEILSGLTQLIDQSLVILERAHYSGTSRYRMLETIRQYALEKLTESPDAAATRRQHLAYFTQLAEQSEPRLHGPEQVEWLERLDVEHDNLRVALEWSLASNVVVGLRLAVALSWWWVMHDFWHEGREWLMKLTACPESLLNAAIRARALNIAGEIAWYERDYESAQAFHAESLALHEGLGLAGRSGLADAAFGLGRVARRQGDLAAACSRYLEVLAIRRELADKHGIASTLLNLGAAVLDQGDLSAAQSYLSESLALWRELGDLTGIAPTLNFLGVVCQQLGDTVAAANLYTESCALFKRLGDKFGMSYTLSNLGNIDLQRGYLQQAGALFKESLSLVWALKLKQDIAAQLAGLAIVAAELQQVQRATQLMSATLTFMESTGAQFPRFDRQTFERRLDAARVQLGDAMFNTAWEAGRRMTLDEVIDYALETAHTSELAHASQFRRDD